MKRSFIREQLAVLLASLVIVALLAAVLLLWRPDAVRQFEFGGYTLDLAANLVQILAVPVPFFVIGLVVLINLPIFVWRRLRARYWPPVGLGSIPENHFDAVVEGMEGQKLRLAEKSWPAHPARAQAARSPTSVHLGNANFSIPARDRRRIRHLVGRRRRAIGDETMRDNVLVVTGEPGAGKSVLGQEIHASLCGGVAQRHHALIPIVLFASDLTAEMLMVDTGQTPDLRALLIQYFKSFATTRFSRFADFLDVNWGRFDFLIVIDGLDEIAQRSVYEKMQWQLRRVIEAELADQSKRPRQERRSRRLILSCRLGDNIGVFSEGDSVVLHGLQTERERTVFCGNMIQIEDMLPEKKSAVKAALSKNSSSLSSVDIFRRNPYFLAFLLNYYKSNDHSAIDRSIDFDFLIKDYIGRDAERAHAHAVGAPAVGMQNRQKLRRSLERCASIFLQYLAFYMTSLEQEDSLYDQAKLSPELVRGFVQAALSSDDSENSGVWPVTQKFLHRLAEGRAMNDEELNEQLNHGHLDENDLRIFNDLSLTSDNAASSIMKAFSVIALEGRLEAVDWYRTLAGHLASVAGDAFLTPGARMAVLLLARGLVAAHVLRLIYIEDSADIADGDGGPTVRFRHRRLAEFYAASYFRDRWETLQPIDDSPWMTPVLNLVAAIEGERCYALNWFVDRLERNDERPTFAWQIDVTAAAEAAAFAHRGGAFKASVAKLVSRLLQLLHDARAKNEAEDKDAKTPGRRDLVTERTLINAVDFIASLGVGPFNAGSRDTYASFFAMESQEPSHLLLYSGRIAYAFSSLAGRPRPLTFRLGSIWKALRDPNTIIGEAREAIANGLAVEWSLTLAYVLVVEVGVALGIAWSTQWTVARALPPVSPTAAPVALWVAATFTLLWCVWRLMVWRRSPSQAALLARMPIGVLFVMLMAFLVAGYLAIRGLILAPGALVKASRAVMQRLQGGLPKMGVFFLAVVGWAFRLVIGGLVGVGLVGLLIFLLNLGDPPSRAQNGGPDTVAEPLIPAEIAKIKCPASEALLAYRRPKQASLADARREVTRLYQGTVAEWRSTPCAQKFPRSDKTNGSYLDLLDRVLDRDPLLIPDPQGRPPSFSREQFDRLEAAARKPELTTPGEGPIAGIAGLLEAGRLSRQRTEYSKLQLEMWRARGEGRLSNMDQGYPSGESYAAFARRVEILDQEYGEHLKWLNMRHKILQERARRTWVWWGILVPGILAIIGLIWQGLAHRKDNATFERLRKASTSDICNALALNPYSDRLRQRLKHALLSREQISRAEIELVDDLAQQFSARSGPRDQRFAVDLGTIVPELSNRLARR